MANKVPELILETPSGEKIRFTLDKKRTRIGRSNENEIIINDRLSSRTHAIIREIDGLYYLSDQNSSNGTKLNGHVIEREEELEHGDEITIGTTTFTLINKTESSFESTDAEFSEADFADIEEEHESLRQKGLDWKILLVTPLAILAIFVVYYFLTQDEGNAPLPPIELPDPLAYGFIPNGDTKHADKVVYAFDYIEGNLELRYKVWDIDKKGEVNIYLNREKIDEVEPTESGHWSGLRELKLPPELVAKNKRNYVIFDNPKNPPGTLMWGVAEVTVTAEKLFPCDETKAKTAYELGKKSYEDKLVVVSNLYRAIEKFEEADRYLKSCAEKPDFYFDNKLKLDDATRELNNQYKNRLFEFNKHKRIKRFDQAEIDLRYLKDLIPNPDDERHIKIKREERYLRRSYTQ